MSVPAVLAALFTLVAGLLMVGVGAPATAAPAAARAAEVTSPSNTSPPTVSGRARYAATLSAQPGEWTSAPTSYSYRWLRKGAPIKGADEATYQPDLDDLGRRLSVEVTATNASGSATATSAKTARIQRAPLRAKGGQKITGVTRYTRTLVARSGKWKEQPTRLRYQWLRFGKPIAGATGKRYRIAPGDVGKRLRVLIPAKAPGYVATQAKTDKTARIAHRVDARRVVRYHVSTRGAIHTSLKTFTR